MRQGIRWGIILAAALTAVLGLWLLWDRGERDARQAAVRIGELEALAQERETAWARELEELEERFAGQVEDLEQALEDLEEALRVQPWELPLSVELQGHVQMRCRQTGVPVELVFAVMERESGFDPEARGVNPGGTVDLGLMQINSVNWEWLAALGVDVNDPRGNIDAGVLILSRFYAKGYGTREVLASYAAGEAGMRRGAGDWYAAEIEQVMARQLAARPGADG